MRSVIAIMLTAFPIMSAEAAYAGPFGFKAGMSAREVNLPQGSHILRTAPAPDPSFDEYTLKFSEKHGLCFLVATTEFINDDLSGLKIQNEFLAIIDRFNALYGKGAMREITKSATSKPWLSTIVDNETTFYATWGSDGAPVSNEIKQITMSLLFPKTEGQIGSQIIASFSLNVPGTCY